LVRRSSSASKMTKAALAPDRSSARTPAADRLSSQKAEHEVSGRRDDRRGATVSWYGKLLIVGMLLVAAGWQIFRWILTIITLD
jgi:hypothetical protein